MKGDSESAERSIKKNLEVRKKTMSVGNYKQCRVDGVKKVQ